MSLWPVAHFEQNNFQTFAKKFENNFEDNQ